MEIGIIITIITVGYVVEIIGHNKDKKKLRELEKYKDKRE